VRIPARSQGERHQPGSAQRDSSRIFAERANRRLLAAEELGYLCGRTLGFGLLREQADAKVPALILRVVEQDQLKIRGPAANPLLAVSSGRSS
jgi:hypothetical protein